MRNIMNALLQAEKALADGNANCGGGPDNIYHAPLRRLRILKHDLVGAAPALDLVLRWAAGEVNDVPTAQLNDAVTRLRRVLG